MLLRPGIGLVEVFADPIELVGEAMKGALVLRVEFLEQVFFVKNLLGSAQLWRLLSCRESRQLLLSTSS